MAQSLVCNEASAGMDLRANIEEPITPGSLERALVPTGIFMNCLSVMRPR